MNIKNIIFINLDKRTDRLEHVREQLLLIGKTGERFKAIELKNGLIGCALSHIKCLELAKARGWDHVFICEDDIMFNNPKLFLQQLSKFFKSGLVWDVVLVAGNNVPPYKKFGNFCIKVSHCQTTTGYIIKSHYYDVLIKNFKEGVHKLLQNPDNHLKYGLDKYWLSLQKKDNWYLIIPPTIVQLPGYSDILHKFTDYSYHLTDIDKKKMLELARKYNLKIA